ncbi:MAG: isoleucine--tRNA ligase [Patescibacteria group bacterium]
MPNYPEREKEILNEWEDKKIFQKSVEKDAVRGNFVFYEGPPTANGKPGIHHVEARAFKDCIPRFRTMQGYKVVRKAGWDTHGLPVELEVEKELGFKSKNEIEEYGVEKFNEKCKQSVWKYKDEWQDFTKRIGYWLDLENPYVTYDPKYVESLWWIIKQVWDKELLYKDYRVTPHCPRCESSLSSHELSQGYKEVEDPAVYVKFKVTKLPDGTAPTDNEYLVAWTTTPWTLPSNVALAVGDQVEYVKIKIADEFFWLAKARVKDVVSGEYETVDHKSGKEITGMEYEPLFPFVREALKNSDQASKKAWYVVPADFVSTTEGSGIVHTAVMYGVDDFELGTKLDLPKYHLVDLSGKFIDLAGAFAGRFVKSADRDILADLTSRNLVLFEEKVKHSYPFCWRCKAPVIYYAKDSWYIKMSALRDVMISQNQNIHWEPEHLKEGRFGEWLREVKDWAFSRERYWGTPLPIWECERCEKRECFGSYEELKKRANEPVADEFDPHRPYVDAITITCSCGRTAKRVSDVCDVWFDSGAMPFAQWHYPFENKEKIDDGLAYPADYISEAIDQTRGWFYTLLAVSTLLGCERPFKNVVCLGHVLDAKGKKMSKSIGNVVDPIEMIEKYGADAVRWYMYSINQPGESKRFDEKMLSDMVRKNFTILMNIVSFYQMFASEKTQDAGPVVQSEHVLDRWILSQLNTLVDSSTKHLENYKITEPVRAIGEYIQDLSTWYLRRSRDRFKGDDEQDKANALATLKYCLVTVAKVMAPFAPFIAEDIYLQMGGEKESVHLEDWPLAGEINNELLKDMAQVRAIVTLALEKRAEQKVNIRQVLAGMSVSVASGELDEKFIDVLKDEVNVKEIVVIKGEQAVEMDFNLTPELVREGSIREIIRRTNAMRKNAGLTIEDRIVLCVKSDEHEIKKALQEHKDVLLAGVLADELVEDVGQDNKEEFEVNGSKVEIGFTKK